MSATTPSADRLWACIGIVALVLSGLGVLALIGALIYYVKHLFD